MSVVTKGLPVPPAKMTIRPFSRWRVARRRMYGSATLSMRMAVCKRVSQCRHSKASCSRQAVQHRGDHAHVVRGRFLDDLAAGAELRAARICRRRLTIASWTPRWTMRCAWRAMLNVSSMSMPLLPARPKPSPLSFKTTRWYFGLSGSPPECAFMKSSTGSRVREAFGNYSGIARNRQTKPFKPKKRA